MMGAGLGDVGGFIGGIAAGLVAVTAVITAYFGLRRYRDDSRERSGRWLTDLQQRFVSEPSFQVVRREIYNGDGSDLTRAWKRNGVLLRDAEARASNPLCEDERRLLVALDDYLEFLSLLERLIQEKELKERDAYTMFGWYGLEGTVTRAINAEIRGNFPKVAALRERFKRIYREDTGKEWAPSRTTPPLDPAPPRITPTA